MTLTEAFNLYNNSNYFQKNNVVLIVTIILILITLFFSIILLILTYNKKEKKQNSSTSSNEAILIILILSLILVSAHLVMIESITNLSNKIKNNTEAFNQFYLRYHQNELSAENQQLLKEAQKQFYELNIEEKEIKNDHKTCYSWNLNKAMPTETYCLSNKNSEANKETKDEFEKFIIMRYLFNEKHHPKWNED